MKLGLGFLKSVVFGLCANVACIGFVHGQCYQPIQDAGWVTSVVTTSGVTSVEYQWLLIGCDFDVNIGPLVRNGNNFSFNFDIEGNPCGPCPMIAFFESTNVVLGVLAPGTYTLITTSWNVPMWTNTFTVAPVLQPIGFDTNGFFQIQMSSGITNVNYMLQCSTNLVDWTSVSTNRIGMALTDNSPILSGCRFYRVLCQ